MQILTVDIGTGTQDVLLFDSDREIENCFKMVMPAPTVVIAERIRDATRRGEAVVFTGLTMGGGPSHWAAMDHLKAGYTAYATPEAAQTFDDDLDGVRAMGFTLISDDEVGSLGREVREIPLGDFAVRPLLETFQRFGARVHLDGVAVAVFDHGTAPVGYSDRAFRFDYLRERLKLGHDLARFGSMREAIPESMTRLRAAASGAPLGMQTLAMDTASAAVLGALEDARVASSENAIVANVGNFHTLAFHLVAGRIAGLFEHHTGELSAEKLARYVGQLADGSISNDEVFGDKGHGALVLDAAAGEPELMAVTGPRRQLAVEAGLRPHLAVPHGDMMLTGNMGLLRSFAAHDSEVREAVEHRLGARGLPL